MWSDLENKCFCNGDYKTPSPNKPISSHESRFDFKKSKEESRAFKGPSNSGKVYEPLKLRHIRGYDLGACRYLPGF